MYTDEEWAEACKQMRSIPGPTDQDVIAELTAQGNREDSYHTDSACSQRSRTGSLAYPQPALKWQNYPAVVPATAIAPRPPRPVACRAGLKHADTGGGTMIWIESPRTGKRLAIPYATPKDKPALAKLPARILKAATLGKSTVEFSHDELRVFAAVATQKECAA